MVLWVVFVRIKPLLLVNQMSKTLANLILFGAAVVVSALMIFSGEVLPTVLVKLTGGIKKEELQYVFSPITVWAFEYAWAFGAAAFLICISAAVCFARKPSQVSQWLAFWLSAEGLVFWVGMFCYCYGGFTGSMCLHHGPHFEPKNFFAFGFGVFPVTLCAIAAPGVAAIISLRKPVAVR
jgi:hypothetical protein